MTDGQAAPRTGLLGLVGGDEFSAGNEEQDAVLATAATGRGFVVPTAAARQRPDRAVDNARRWFRRFGLDLEPLDVLTRSDAKSDARVATARSGSFFYLVGGDPGLVLDVLRDSPVFTAIRAAWRDGAVLAGSSAGAMALAEWALLRASWPQASNRRFVPALGCVPGCAVLPHFNAFGRSWLRSARESAPAGDVRLVGLDEHSCALWDGERWRALGPGCVTVVTGDGAEHPFASGAGIDLLPPLRPG